MTTLTFARTEDWPEIKRIMTDEHVYPHISDDAAPKREDFEPNRSPEFHYVLVKRDGETLGLWVLYEMDGGDFEIHTCLLPASYGIAAVAGRACAKWIWRYLPKCQRITTAVPAYNRLALALAKATGMTEFRRAAKLYPKNGEMYDVIFLELRRPECLS